MLAKGIRIVNHNKKRQYYSINTTKTTSVATTMVIGMIPILLILSIIAAISSLSFSTFQLAYSQGSPPTRQEQQQDLNDTTFQTANVTINGIMYPIKYNITNDDAAKLVSTVAQKESAKLIVTIAPTKDGKLMIILPRNLTDYKIAGGKDGMFVVNINAKQITNFQEMSNNKTARELQINFGKDDRVIELIGTQMGQGDIATVKGQAKAEMMTTTSQPSTSSSPKTATNMTEENVPNNASQAAGANVSQTGKSIINNTGEAAQTFVNKTASVLGNVTGEVSELFGGKK